MNKPLIFILISLAFCYPNQVEPSTFEIFSNNYLEEIEKVIQCKSISKDSLEFYSAEIMKPFISRKYARKYSSIYDVNLKYDIRKDIENVPFLISLIDYSPRDDSIKRDSKYSWLCDEHLRYRTDVNKWHTYPVKFLVKHTTLAWIDSNKTEIIQRVRNREWSNPIDSLTALAMIPEYAVHIADTISYYPKIPLWLKARMGDQNALDLLISEYNEISDIIYKNEKTFELLLTQNMQAYQAIVKSINTPVFYSKTKYRKKRRSEYISNSLSSFKKVYSSDPEYMKLYNIVHSTARSTII